MRCHECDQVLSKENYYKTKEKYGKPLCYRHQPTKYALDLFNKLKSKYHVDAELEKKVGRKHIDIAIVKAKLNIEVDGLHHSTDHKQAMKDIMRTESTLKKGFITIRVPNKLVREKLEWTAYHIYELIKANIKNISYNK